MLYPLSYSPVTSYDTTAVNSSSILFTSPPAQSTAVFIILNLFELRQKKTDALQTIKAGKNPDTCERFIGGTSHNKGQKIT